MIRELFETRMAAQRIKQRINLDVNDDPGLFGLVTTLQPIDGLLFIGQPCTPQLMPNV